MNRQNLLTLLATFALLFCFTYFCNAKGKDKAKHVVFIGLSLTYTVSCGIQKL